MMTDTRAPRPTDLVALVTFDGEVRENLAVTREHLGQPSAAPRPLSAAIEQWLHLGRRTWISLAGREIRGIATARDLAERSAWQVDTLIETDPAEGDVSVLRDLLRQASVAAADAEATHLLLRTPNGSIAEQEAPREGFSRVVREQLWAGALVPLVPSADVTVREAAAADTHAMFQAYSRAWPANARQAFAMTLDEWQATQEPRWIERGVTLVAEQNGVLAGYARTSRTGQFTLLAMPGADAAADALLAGVAARLGDGARHVVLLAECGVTEAGALQRAGMEPERAFTLHCKRIARPVRDEAYVRAGIPITG